MGKVRFNLADNDDDDDEDDKIGDRTKLPLTSPLPLLPATPMKPISAELRGNMMRAHQNRDPLFYYEIVSVLGVGSMGSVAKVRKRPETMGGSARKNMQEHFRKEKRHEACFSLPLVGGLFRMCIKPDLVVADSSNHSAEAMSAASSSIIHGNSATSVEDYNDGHGEHEDNMYAMKSIHLSRVTDPSFLDELRNEIAILKTLDHYNISKAMETFEYRNQIFVVMELLSGGDLYSRDPYTEEEAARIVSCVLSAIAYMHDKGVAHRDLKYENILFADNTPYAEIKLIDFGLSKAYINDQQDMTEGVGTIYTMAPEVLKGHYTKQADLWSIGVIAFMLMSSQMPFYGRKRSHIVEQIMSGSFEFKGRRWKRISPQAKSLVEDLLVFDPDDRLTAEQALSAAWLNRRFGATMRNPYEAEMLNSRKTLLQYAKYSRLKKLALMVVAHKSASHQIGILRKIFQKYDTSKDGQLSYDEFKAAIYDIGLKEENYQEIFDAVDLDGTGIICYTEFLAATIEAQGPISETRLAEAFDRIDCDDSGYITAANLKEILGENFPKDEIEKIINEADLTHDHRISYDEFLALWNNPAEDEGLADIRNAIKVDSERSFVSDISSDSRDTTETEAMARTSFLAEKRRMSERRSISPSVQAQRHAVFLNQAEHIPSVTFDENDGLNKNGNTACADEIVARIREHETRTASV